MTSNEGPTGNPNVDNITESETVRIDTDEDLATFLSQGAMKYVIQSVVFDDWIEWMVKVQIEGGNGQEEASSIREIGQEAVANLMALANELLGYGLRMYAFAGEMVEAHANFHDLSRDVVGKAGVDTPTTGQVG